MIRLSCAEVAQAVSLDRAAAGRREAQAIQDAARWLCAECHGPGEHVSDCSLARVVASGVVYDVLAEAPGCEGDMLLVIRRPKGSKEYLARRCQNQYGNTAILMHTNAMMLFTRRQLVREGRSTASPIRLA
jgi:hypothetical protein